MYARIVVPLDGSYLAERALAHAEELARCMAAPIHLVRVVDVARLERFGAHGFEMTGDALSQAIFDEVATATDYLKRTDQSIRARGIAVTSEVRRGVAASELVAAARPDDLIVMTSHGRGGLSGSYHGSVAEEVLRRAPAPVLVIRCDVALPLPQIDARIESRS